MVYTKSLEYVNVFIALLCDVQALHSNVMTTSDLRKTTKVVRRRFSREGIGFLTKTLPRLGKAFDKALSCHEPLDSTVLAFTSYNGCKFPKLFGELFSQVLDKNGAVLHSPDVVCIRSLRQLMFLFYKLELPNDPKLEQATIEQFVKTEQEVALHNILHEEIHKVLQTRHDNPTRTNSVSPGWVHRTLIAARRRLGTVFAGFDHADVYPRHGPGVVSTKERLWRKYQWTNIPDRIAQHYPIDAYFYASLSHVCDKVSELTMLTNHESSAQVLLVPKDSRGPRLISCEPLEFQWIQQGLGRAIVKHVEEHPLTRYSVHFTDQSPNQRGALLGSQTGRYATLDLKEASDRVTVGIVRLLFPEPLNEVLLSCRSLATKLPDGRVIALQKFAPMGSALCFPVLALTTWALLAAGLEVFGASESVIDSLLVYGDDVVVPAEYAEHAMIILESFGLKINRDKSCTKGFFRESCGVDAFAGKSVTPVRFRTPWSSFRRPEVYTSWISYANSMYIRGYKHCYDMIVGHLKAVYRLMVTTDYRLSVPSLCGPLDSSTVPRRRWNKNLQKFEYRVYDVEPYTTTKEIDGWSMLLRYFSEARSSAELYRNRGTEVPTARFDQIEPFSVRAYTYRKRNKIRLRWR